MRAFLGGGLFLVGIGLLLMGGLGSRRRLDGAAAGFIAAGIGIGCVNPPLATAAIGVVEPRRSGAASGINSTFRQVGIATGIAALGALLQARVTAKLGDALAGVPLPPGAKDRLGEAVVGGGTQAATQAAPPGARDVVAGPPSARSSTASTRS